MNKDYAKMVYSIVFKKNIPIESVLQDEGNIKIPATTAIFNMGSATDCPSFKLKLCNAEKCGVKCYAKKAERCYRPHVLPYRRRQETFWKSVSAEEFAVQFLTMNAKKIKPFQALRINESGDFWTQECVNKAEKIARILKPYGIVTYCYTSRCDLDYHKVRALRVSGSGFKKEGIVNIFKIINSKQEKPKGYGMCAGNCRICNRCSKAGMKTAVLKH